MSLAPNQPEGPRSQFVKYLHPEVVGSNTDDFPVGSVFESYPGENLVSTVRNGINVTFSPIHIREGVDVGDELLLEGPHDALAIGEIASGNGLPSTIEKPYIGEPRILYSNGGFLTGRITHGTLSLREYSENSGSKIHFAFVPAVPGKGRQIVGIDRGWKKIE